jgi:hypothetical protein
MSYKRVRPPPLSPSPSQFKSDSPPSTELDALSDLDESEPSYLNEVSAPDFLDEAPHVPANEVSVVHGPGRGYRRTRPVN